MSLNGPAAARLYDEHVDAIYEYAARRLGPDLAITVVADVFEQALARHDRPEGGGSERGRLLAITTALLRRHGATEQARLVGWGDTDHGIASSLDVGDPLLSSGSGDHHAGNVAAVMAAVAELEPADRDLLLLTAWERCSSGLTAEALGISQGTVRSRLAGVRKELKRRVAASRPDLDGEIEA